MILTGGDPFILSPRRAGDITHRLAATGHVKVIRWHTRVPMVDPARVSDDFIAALMAPGVTAWVAIHANHPREFSPEAKAALARLVDAGIPLVSQSVLLKGVNDNVETLAALMRAFVENRIKPYYLHHPDLARGTSHFRIGIDEGLALTRRLAGAAVGPGPAHLCAGYSRRLRQSAAGFRRMSRKPPPAIASAISPGVGRLSGFLKLRRALRLRFGRSSLEMVHWTISLPLPSGRSPKLAALVALAGPPDLLTSFRMPLPSGRSPKLAALVALAGPPDLLTSFRMPLPSGRSPKLAALVALAGPPDLLTSFRMPLLAHAIV